MGYQTPEVREARRLLFRRLRAEGLTISDITYETGACASTVCRAVADMPRHRMGPEPRYRDPARNRRLLAAWEAAGHGERRHIASEYGFKSYGAAATCVNDIRRGKHPS